MVARRTNAEKDKDKKVGQREVWCIGRHGVEGGVVRVWSRGRRGKGVI